MKIKNLFAVLLLLATLPLATACSNKDDDAVDPSFDIKEAYGTWMCTKSTDSYQGYSQDGLLVGAEITIRSDATYTSTSENFGYRGTYTYSGNKITARNSNGDSFVVTVTISGNTMKWMGTASTGVSFSYVFQRET